MLPSSTLLVLQPGRLFETALPVLVVAVVTQLTLVVRSTLDDRKIRRFKRADLAAEVRAGLRVLEVFMDSCADGAPASLRDLGPGLAITVAPIQCHQEYATLSIAIKDALPTLSDGEFQAAATLKGCFRLISGYTEACNKYFRSLQSVVLSSGATEESLEVRRQILRRFGEVAMQEIEANANQARQIGWVLLEAIEDRQLQPLVKNQEEDG